MLRFMELFQEIIQLWFLTHIFLGPITQVLLWHARLRIEREVCALQVWPQWLLVLKASLLLAEIVITFKGWAFQWYIKAEEQFVDNCFLDNYLIKVGHHVFQIGQVVHLQLKSNGATQID